MFFQKTLYPLVCEDAILFLHTLPVSVLHQRIFQQAVNLEWKIGAHHPVLESKEYHPRFKEPHMLGYRE